MSFFPLLSHPTNTPKHTGLVLYLFLFLLHLQLNLCMETWSLIDFWQSSASCADKHSLALGIHPTAGAWFCSCVSEEAGRSPTLSFCVFEVMIYHQHYSHNTKGKEVLLPRLGMLDMGGGHREHM